MSYSTVEGSTQGGAPKLLCYFSRGSTEWRFTSSEDPVVALGQTWVPSPFKIGQVNQTNEIAKDILSIQFPLSDSFAQSFLEFPPDFTTTVTVYRGHATDQDSEFIAYWKGRVGGHSFRSGNLNLECEPVFTSLRRMGLRAIYQKTCRHALYGRGCGLSLADFEIAVKLVSIDQLVLTVSDISALASTYLIGGIVASPGGAYRRITAQTSSTVTIDRRFESLEEDFAQPFGYGQDYGNHYGDFGVMLYPGCDHVRNTCSTKFNNIENFGGFPWIPGKNPFGGSSLV